MLQGRGLAGWATVAIAICSWVALSNHCALGALTARTGSAPCECLLHSGPAQPQPQKRQPGETQCCRILRALVPVFEKKWTHNVTNFFGVDVYVEQFTFTGNSGHVSRPLLLDTGPPGKTLFAELIGSVRAHAPPNIA